MPDNTSKAKENFERYVYARDNGHTDFVDKADRCEKFFRGLQWDEKVRRRLERQRKPVVTVNKVLATLNTVMGEQLQNRADVTFRPFKNGNSETASALAKVYLQIANSQKLHWKESEVFDDGIITSRGFYDLRVKFDRNLTGEVDVAVLNPKNVIVDPDANSYDPDDWTEVFITKWMNAEEIEATYGRGKADKLKHKAHSDFFLSYDSIDDQGDNFSGETEGRSGDRPKDKKNIRVIERQFRKRRTVPHFVNPETGDIRPVPENWDLERIEQAKQVWGLEVILQEHEAIRWTVSADTELLFDDWSPYQHFTVVPYFPFFRRGQTIGLAETLIDINEVLNKTISQEMHVINSSANGGWKIRRGSLHNMDIDELESRGAETGLVLELDTPADAEKIQPNQIPTGLDRLSFKIDEYIKEVSGISDSLRGFDREDVAAKAIRAKQAAGSVNLAKPLDNLVRTRYLLARNILDLIQQFYTETRVLQITDDTAGSQPQELVINQPTPWGEVVNDLTVGEYDVVISSVPTRESYLESQFDEALRLRELGIPIPDQYLIENSHLAKKNEILESMSNDAAAQMQQQMAELEMAEKQADIQNKQADFQRKQSQAGLDQARAQKTQVDAQVAVNQAQQEDPVFERAKQEAELQLEREKMMMEMELQRQRMMMEMQLKQEEMRQNMLLRQAEAELRMEQQAKQDQYALASSEQQLRQQDEAHKLKLKQGEAMAKQKVKSQGDAKRG